MDTIVAAVAAVAAGAALALQALVNARLGSHLGGPLWASLVSLQVGALCLVLLQLATRATLPGIAQIQAVPLWVWCGGLLGAAYLTGTLFSVGRLGAASTIALIVFGQMIASLLLDRFGILVAEPHDLSPARLCGAGLLLAGVVLITRG